MSIKNNKSGRANGRLFIFAVDTFLFCIVLKGGGKGGEY